MKGKQIGYWASTGLVAAAMGVGGIFDILSPPQVVEQFMALGYPAYVLPMLGVWKVLGTVAVLAPRFPRLKEWAYAGFVFDLVGASVSHAAVGDSADKVIAPLVFLGLAVASWALRPDHRRLDAPAESEVQSPVAPVAEAPRTA